MSFFFRGISRHPALNEALTLNQKYIPLTGECPAMNQHPQSTNSFVFVPVCPNKATFPHWALMGARRSLEIKQRQFLSNTFAWQAASITIWTQQNQGLNSGGSQGKQTGQFYKWFRGQ